MWFVVAIRCAERSVFLQGPLTYRWCLLYRFCVFFHRSNTILVFALTFLREVPFTSLLLWWLLYFCWFWHHTKPCASSHCIFEPCVGIHRRWGPKDKDGYICGRDGSEIQRSDFGRIHNAEPSDLKFSDKVEHRVLYNSFFSEPKICRFWYKDVVW